MSSIPPLLTDQPFDTLYRVIVTHDARQGQFDVHLLGRHVKRGPLQRDTFTTIDAAKKRALRYVRTFGEDDCALYCEEGALEAWQESETASFENDLEELVEFAKRGVQAIGGDHGDLIEVEERAARIRTVLTVGSLEAVST